MKQIFLRNDRLIFEGDQKYTADETTKLQGFFKFLKEKREGSKQM